MNITHHIKNTLYASLFALSTFCQYASAETITIGAEDSWPPYSSPDGTGFSHMIVQEAYAEVGIDVNFEVASYARLLRDVEHGKLLALFNVTKEASTEAIYNFGQERLFLAKTFYYQRKDIPVFAQKKEELINSERVGMIIGYEYGPFILQNTKITPIRVQTQESLIRMLLRDRLDTAIMFEAVANATFPKVPGANALIEKAFEGEHSNIYVAFSPSFTKTKYYMAKLDEGLKILKSRNRIQEILANIPIPQD